MIHITETKRWKYWDDEISRREYYEMHPVAVFISPKQRKAKYLSSLKGYKIKDLSKLTSKQLGAILYRMNAENKKLWNK